MRFAIEEFFSYKSRYARKQRIFLFRRATYKGTYVEAVESAREGGSREGKVPCVLHQEFLFLVHKYLGSERPVSFEYRLLRDLVYEEAISEGSSGNGLPYAAKGLLYAHIKQEQYLNRTTLRRLKIPLRSFCSEECRTIALERSVSEKAVI